MKNYNILNDKIKDEMINFINKLSTGLGKVDTHFITDMVNGIISNNSVILSDIARTMNERPNIKKSVERLERHLDKYEDIKNIIEINYESLVKNYLNNRKLYFVDGGDIVKNKNTKFENMGWVLDGSDEHKVKTGYKLFEIDSIDHSNQPISIISELSSSLDEEYDSDNSRWLELMNEVSKKYGKGTFIMDRGFDSGILMDKIIKNGNDFIIRANKLERYIYLNGDKTTIRNIAMKCKGFYKLDVNYRGNNHKLKVTAKTIKIQNKEAKELENNLLTLIIIKGFAINTNTLNEAYMALITSRKVSSRNDVLQVVRDYLLRWRIEENFRYKKQQFNLENIRIRKYNRLQTMYNLLSMIMIFNNIINIKAIGKTVRKIKKHIREKIIFWLYRISDGIKAVISFFSTELIKIIYPRRQKRRRDLFTVMGVAFR